MSSPVVFYVPCLRGASVPHLPPGARLFPSGLPSSPAGKKAVQGKDVSDKDAPGKDVPGARTDEVCAAVLAAFPLPPREALAALDELTRLGLDLASGGLLRGSAHAGRLPGAREESFGCRRGERAALEAFAATGDLLAVPDWSAPQGPDPTALEHARVEAQKTLLLAWQLEGRALEIQELERGIALSGAALAAAFHDGDAALEEAETREAGRSASEDALPWRLIVEAMTPFIPGDCLLFTADSAMAFDLMEAGLLEPLPEDRGAALNWPAELLDGLLWASLPAWKLTGRRGEDPLRPWLSRRVEVFAARPEGGWLR